MNQLEYHPAANLFPMMTEHELKELATDIKANGLLEPITLYHGQILDGRNRYQACQLGNVEPRFENRNGDIASPVLFVASKNLHRRHLTIEKRSFIAARMQELYRNEAHERMVASLKQNQQHSPLGSKEPSGKPIHATAIVAEKMGVSPASVKRAARLIRVAPELIEQVEKGEITLSAAYKKAAKQPHGGQKPTTISTARGLTGAISNKKRMIDGLMSVDGLCEGLSKLNIGLIRQVCSEDERRDWHNKACELAASLRNFGKQLKDGGQ